jgi:hypothetical protein
MAASTDADASTRSIPRGNVLRHPLIFKPLIQGRSVEGGGQPKEAGVGDGGEQRGQIALAPSLREEIGHLAHAPSFSFDPRKAHAPRVPTMNEPADAAMSRSSSPWWYACARTKATFPVSR